MWNMIRPAIEPFPLNPDPSPEHASARLWLALTLQHDGLNMMRLTLSRRFPQDTPQQLSQRLSDWLAYTADLDDPRLEIKPCKAPSSTTCDK